MVIAWNLEGYYAPRLRHNVIRPLAAEGNAGTATLVGNLGLPDGARDGLVNRSRGNYATSEVLYGENLVMEGQYAPQLRHNVTCHRLPKVYTCHHAMLDTTGTLYEVSIHHGYAIMCLPSATKGIHQGYAMMCPAIGYQVYCAACQNPAYRVTAAVIHGQMPQPTTHCKDTTTATP